ncbi:hypothetical protein J2Z21_007899 [Streptomyces griseochromogenes]|uniref:Uncharacterized protein n=1 Tax=Streptomyces griseochromogenes TaxID=68214 RepID=A0A1B1BAS2_9ACTN|nr:hypothetical protein [Streptomyces griseochromogenes]ANP55832.1 hypothetical protein AVL59_45080 [Streptomyces griseochromogenes]MBP2054889.1 hypothetical protein [Streptomyces griseochromogenes]
MTTQPPPYGSQPPYGQQPPPPPATAPPGFGPPSPHYPNAYAPSPPQPPAGGPEFMAVDRHNSIVVDTSGVAFEDHGLSIDFSWQEIRSVHFKASPSGKALMMAVVHLDGRVYECVVEAKPRARLGEWFAQLDPVLGYYRPMGS